MKALRKPTVVAAALNAAVRADTDGVTAIIAAAEALRSGHRSVLQGRTADLAGLRAAHRAAARRVAVAAPRDHERVAELLEAAALDPRLPRPVAQGHVRG